jgi:hypothetical protein
MGSSCGHGFLPPEAANPVPAAWNASEFCRALDFPGLKPWRHLSIHFQWGAQVLISAAFFYSQTGFNSTSNLLISLNFLRRKS